MTKVTLNGWIPGFQTISFVDALRAHCRYDLTRSKEIVDRMLDGEVIVVDAASEADASQLIDKAQLFGAKAQIAREEEAE
jgi:hypothetical protein